MTFTVLKSFNACPHDTRTITSYKFYHSTIAPSIVKSYKAKHEENWPW